MSYPFYNDIDERLSASKPDYISLHQDLLERIANVILNDEALELWWRLAKVSYHLSLDVDYENDEELFIRNMSQTRKYATKAVQSNPNDFEANLWLCQSVGMMALFEANIQIKYDLITQFMTSLNHCRRLNCQHSLIPFLETRLEVALLVNVTNEEEEFLKRKPEFSHIYPINTDMVEMKLQNCLRLMPQSIDIHAILSFVFLSTGKKEEAVKVAEKGVKLECSNKSESLMCSHMSDLISHMTIPQTGFPIRSRCLHHIQ